jgi:hypothetical protein
MRRCARGTGYAACTSVILRRPAFAVRIPPGFTQRRHLNQAILEDQHSAPIVKRIAAVVSLAFLPPRANRFSSYRQRHDNSAARVIHPWPSIRFSVKHLGWESSAQIAPAGISVPLYGDRQGGF